MPAERLALRVASARAPTLSPWTRSAYAAINLPVGLLYAPSLAVLPTLYVKHTSVSLATIGSILVFTRLLDAAVDPLIGYFSDRTRSRIGPRKPWIIAGALLSAVSVWFLFRPSIATGALYFLVWSSLLYVGWSLIETTHSAWINDLTGSYDERSRLATYRYVAVVLGGMLFLLVPLLPVFPTTEMTPQATSFAASIAIALLTLTTLIACLVVPARAPVQQEVPRLADVLREVGANRLLWRFTGITGAAYLASGFVAALYLFFLGSYLGIADKYSHLNLAASACTLIGAPLWMRASFLIGKHRALACCVAAQGLTLVGYAFIPRGAEGFPMAMLVWIIAGLGVSGGVALAQALLADIVDYGTLRSGAARAGQYFAALTLTQKVALAVGGGLSFILVGAFGFDPKGSNDAVAMTGFFVTFMGIPFALFFFAAFLAWGFPLDRHRHAIIVERLRRRGLRAENSHA